MRVIVPLFLVGVLLLAATLVVPDPVIIAVYDEPRSEIVNSYVSWPYVIVTGSFFGLYVVDYSNINSPRERFVELGRNRFTHVHIDDSHIGKLVLYTSNIDGVFIYEVDVLSTIVSAQMTDGVYLNESTSEAIKYGDYFLTAYFIDEYEYEIHLYDVSDPYNITILDSYYLGNETLVQNFQIYDNQIYLLQSQENKGPILSVFSIVDEGLEVDNIELQSPGMAKNLIDVYDVSFSLFNHMQIYDSTLYVNYIEIDASIAGVSDRSSTMYSYSVDYLQESQGDVAVVSISGSSIRDFQVTEKEIIVADSSSVKSYDKSSEELIFKYSSSRYIFYSAKSAGPDHPTWIVTAASDALLILESDPSANNLRLSRILTVSGVSLIAITVFLVAASRVRKT